MHLLRGVSSARPLVRVGARSPLRAAGLVTALAAGLVGCSSGGSGPSQPPVSAFTAGTCRVIAPDVLTIGREALRLGKGPGVDPGVLGRLTAAQTNLRQLTTGAEPVYQAPITAVVTAVGLVRLDARVGTYHPAQGDNLTATYRTLVTTCTHPVPSAS